MTEEKKGKNSKVEKKMFGLKCLKSAVFFDADISDRFVLTLLFFNYAFFDCSYVYFLMYGMVHNKKMYSYAVFSLIS